MVVRHLLIETQHYGHHYQPVAKHKHHRSTIHPNIKQYQDCVFISGRFRYYSDTVTYLINMKLEGYILQDATLPSYRSSLLPMVDRFDSDRWFNCDRVGGWYLWSPYGIRQTIIFLHCGFFFMVALCNRADHNIFILKLWSPYVIGQTIIFSSCFFFLLSSSFFFFPRLISAVGDWMFTILWHMVGLSANLECRSEMRCTRLAANTGRKKSPSRHHRTTAEICWRVWGTPTDFNGFCVLAALLHGI